MFLQSKTYSGDRVAPRNKISLFILSASGNRKRSDRHPFDPANMITPKMTSDRHFLMAVVGYG
jgi:hypothetical protein